jgi:PAS domain-containing protein
MLFYIAPAFLLTAVVLIDYFLFPGVVITPICSLLILGMLALFSPVKPMLLWAFVFSMAAIYVIYHPQYFMHAAHNRTLGHIVHSISIFVGAGISVLLCLNRRRAESRTEDIELLMTAIPLPMIISRKYGEIIFINAQAAQLLGVSIKEAMKHSFSWLLMGDAETSTFITNFLQQIDGAETKDFTTIIKPHNNPEKTLSVTLRAIHGVQDRFLLALISEASTNAA